MKELGEKVHLTGQAASARVAKLEDQGVIEGYTIQVNQVKLGCFIHAFINIYTKALIISLIFHLLKHSRNTSFITIKSAETAVIFLNASFRQINSWTNF